MTDSLDHAQAPITARVLVTGATGYVGARLVTRLLDAGYTVRCAVRTPRKLADRRWHDDPRVEIVRCDFEDPQSLAAAMRGCGPAYYLVHSMMSAGSEYAARDRDLARQFAEAARTAGLTRILYLGGLGETGDDLSEHLTSRREVEDALAASGVPLTVFRAAMILGSGSASFEILRYLVERLPVMITPRWVSTECQPIAIGNVLHYLVAALAVPETTGRTLDIGGPEVLTYRRLMDVMAEERGLGARIVVPVPVLTPWLSSLWIHLVTPLSARIARPLAEGLRNRVVCRNDDAARLMPQPLLPVRDAIREALDHESKFDVETSWSSAGPIPGDPDWAGGTVFLDERSATVRATPQATFDAVCRLGGRSGWHRGNTAVAGARLARSAGRRSRTAARPPPSRARVVRRGARLLARHRHRSRSPPAAAGRDEAARRSVARLPHRTGGGRRGPRQRPGVPAGAGGAVPAARPARPALLVCGDALPRRGVQRLAARHHRTGGATAATRQL